MTLSVTDAIALIEDAARRHVLVLGVEGFEKRGSGILPRMDFIGDYSTVDAPTSAQAALALIREAPAELVWDIELDD